MDKIGRYELLSQLASGNTGYIYTARLIERPVAPQHSAGAAEELFAIKLIKPRLTKAEPRYLQVLLREAPAAVDFIHPVAVRHVEIAKHETTGFLTMQIFRGQTLSAVLQRSAAHRRPLSPELILWIGCRLANALQAAHERMSWEGEGKSMVHGEVSPQSVVINYDGHVKLLGVGVGRSRLCLPPARMRLPYRAPELFERNSGDPSSDIYGLGVVLYDAITRKPAFARESVAETRQAVLDNVFLPLGVQCPDVNGLIDELIGRMMSRKPSARPATMAEVEITLRSEFFKSDEVMAGQLAEEMHILFAEEIGEMIGVSAPTGRAPLVSPWNSETPMSATAGPSSSVLSPPPSPAPLAASATPTGFYDEFELDSLVDAIVASSAQKGARPKNSVPPDPRVERAPTPDPAVGLGPDGLASPFSRALDQQASEFEVDALVDAIVHASAKARQKEPLPVSRMEEAIAVPTPPPMDVDDTIVRPEPVWGEKGAHPREIRDNDRLPRMTIKESFHRGAIVDVTYSPKSKTAPPMAAGRRAEPLAEYARAEASSEAVSARARSRPESYADSRIENEARHPLRSEPRQSAPRIEPNPFASPFDRPTAPVSPQLEVHRGVVPSARSADPAADDQSLFDRGPQIPPLGEGSDGAQLESILLRKGEILGDRYRVVEKLGVGGMAVVYKVEHMLLQKMLALKLLRPELSVIPYVVQRFQQEARCVSQLDNPHIVRVTDFGRAESGSLFLVMELIEGDLLTRSIEIDSPMPLADAFNVIEQILDGLEHAHRNNVIHRDLKPDNIMVVRRNGRPQLKIVDFGIAKLVGDEPISKKPLTQAGMVFGSPRYMSPEQANGEPADARSDIYAAGIILYELLTGRRPFDGKSANAIFSRLLTQAPPRMNLAEPTRKVGRAIEQVIIKALAKDKDERYPSAAAFWHALQGCLGKS